MCTGAIVSSSCSESGKPLLLKHRDISYVVPGQQECRVVYCNSRRYGKKGILAVVDDNQRQESVLCGTNAAGFSIINTATYNFEPRNYNTQYTPSRLMYEALSICRDKDDFEKLLNDCNRKLMPANYGISDSSGRTFYYEVSERKRYSIDVSSQPTSRLAFTNFSRKGDGNSSMPGLQRFNTADSILNDRSVGMVSPEFLFNKISRSFKNDILNIDLIESGNPFGKYFPDGYFIPLRSSTFSAVFEGNVLWVSLGYPPLSAVVPVVLGRDIPDIPVKSFSAAKFAVFDLNVGEGNRYFDFSRIFNGSGTGWMQQIMELEKCMFDNFSPSFNDVELAEFYNFYLEKIGTLYGRFEKETGTAYDRYRLCQYGEKRDEVVKFNPDMFYCIKAKFLDKKKNH